MVFDVSKVSGIPGYTRERKVLGEGVDAEEISIYCGISEEEAGAIHNFDFSKEFERTKPFLVKRKHTIEIRCDEKLAKLLRDKYESVMSSRYFGRGGVEIVDTGQLSKDEICDLVRLSYRLSAE